MTIYRGTKEIGGNCIEVTHEDWRLILDVGMPLVRPDDSSFEWYRSRTLSEVLEQGDLPRVPHLFDINDPKTAVILTHAHQDHYGFSGFVQAATPVFATVGTIALMRISAMFQANRPPHREPQALPKSEPFSWGPFTVTAIPVPHSAPDSVALFIEAGGRRLFYTGDLRGHGRTAFFFDRLLQNPPNNVDVMVMEGTVLGQPPRESMTETDVETRLESLASAHDDLVLMICSSQNLDRLVSTYKAAAHSGRVLVIDLYTAFILKELLCVSERLPQFHWRNVRVKYWPNHAKSLADSGNVEFLYEANPSKIKMPEIAADPRKYFLLTKSNRFLSTIFKPLKNPSRVEVIWSLWKGYWEKDHYLKNFCDRFGIIPRFIHSGGHASIHDLTRLVEAVSPKVLVPIHTFHPEVFPENFPGVRQLADGESFPIP